MNNTQTNSPHLPPKYKDSTKKLEIVDNVKQRYTKLLNTQYKKKEKVTVTIYNDQERCRLLIFPKFSNTIKQYPEIKSPTNKSLSRSETIKLLGHYRSLKS
jgi:Fe-S cluster assembly scaffold protein SufB